MAAPAGNQELLEERRILRAELAAEQAEREQLRLQVSPAGGRDRHPGVRLSGDWVDLQAAMLLEQFPLKPRDRLRTCCNVRGRFWIQMTDSRSEED